jgi:hypothetical protein
LKKVQTEIVDTPGTNDLPWFGTEEFARTMGVKSDGVAIIINGRVRWLVLTSLLLEFTLADMINFLSFYMSPPAPSCSVRIW